MLSISQQTQLKALSVRRPIDEADLDIYSDFNNLQTGQGGALFGISTNEIILPLVQNNVTNAYAIFGELYFDITDQIRLTLGGRYSHEEKELRRYRRPVCFRTHRNNAIIHA